MKVVVTGLTRRVVSVGSCWRSKHSTKTVGMRPMTLASQKNGTAGAAPDETMSCGRSVARIRTARTELRRLFQIRRLVS